MSGFKPLVDDETTKEKMDNSPNILNPVGFKFYETVRG
jgi:hypothetical protein